MLLTEKARSALYQLREEPGQNWRTPSAWLVQYRSSRKTFDEEMLANRYSYSTVSIDDIDIEGVVIGYSREIIPIAMMLGAIKYEPKNDFSVLFVPIDMLEGVNSSSERVRLSKILLDEIPVIFDERDSKASVRTVLEGNRTFWYRPEFIYKGTDVIPDYLAYVYCRNRFLDLIDTVWHNSFIIRPRQSTRQEKSIKAIARASKIANLLLLDMGNFDVFAKKAKCPTWQAAALRKLDISINAFSPEIKEIFNEVSRLQDVADFWCTAADYYGWALRLSTVDLEDGKIEETKKKIATMAELIDLRSYLDAYEAGVPASDILA